MRISRLLITISIILTICSCASAEQQIPPDSFATLQETFTTMRDRLWETSEDFWHNGEYDRCIAAMRLITEIDPYDTQAYDDAAWLMESDLRDDEAEAFLLKGLRNNPDTSDLYFSLGRFYYLHQRFNEAVNYYETATSFEVPEFVWHSLAHAYEHAGLTTDALDIWIQREAVDPADPVPWNQITRIMQGEPASDVPGFISRAREQRRAEEKSPQ